MGWVKDNFFGGAQKDAAKRQQYNYEQAQGQIKEGVDQARKDILGIFPQQYTNLIDAYSKGADLITQGKTSSANILQNAFNQSNQTLQGGNQQVLSALLGGQPQMQLPQQFAGGLRSGFGNALRDVNEPMPATQALSQPTGLGSVGNQLLQTSTGATGNTPQTAGQVQIPQQTALQMPQAQPQQQLPNMGNIGLGGAEQALQGGLQAQTGALQGGLQNQLGALRGGVTGAEEALNAYGNQALGAANQGFGQARQDISGGAQQAVGTLQNAMNQGVNRIDQSTGQAINYLNPYAGAGQSALNQEAALSGALGGAAQQQAINQFMESPGQKFLRERQEQALLRNASATGGLRGGATLTALQEQAAGIAAQQQQQQLENLRSLAGRGQQAATQQGGYAQQGGISGANLIGQLAGQQAGIQSGAAQNLANLATQGGQFGANLLANTGQNVAGLRQGLGAAEAGAFGNTANNMANIYGNTAGNVAGLRSQAGRDVASQLGGTSQQIAGNQLNLGQLLANLDSGTAAQLAQLGIGGATAGANQQAQLAQLLANLATGQGSQLAGLQTGIGDIQAAGRLGQANATKDTIGTIAQLAAMFSDERLKDNITKLVDGPVNLFAWTWKHIKEIPAEMRGVTAIGVIAQEIQQKFPECVHSENGYLKVDYSKLANEVANG